MNRPWGLIYSLTALVVLIALLLVFILRLNTARELSRAENAASHEQIVSSLSDETDLVVLGQQLDEYFATVSTVDALALYFPNRGMVYLRSRDPRLLRIDLSELRNFQGFPNYELGEISFTLERSKLSSPAFEELYLDAVYQVLDYHDVYPPLRDTLIALLGFAFLLVLVTILTSSSGAQGEKAKPKRTRVTTKEAVAPAAPSAEPAPPTSAPETHEVQSETDVLEEIEVEEVSSEDCEPGTLFDPTTGVSFEEHLERKLGLELDRAAYNDQDLSCMIISFPGDPTPEARGRWARHVLDAFQFEDLCFAYGDSQFCAVLPNTELPQAIRQASEFSLRYAPDAIGISARNGRLVEASRVLKEARRSLEHARTQPSRVVGFRPDPKKYRQFLSEQPS